jgi:hypothetical protein
MNWIKKSAATLRRLSIEQTQVGVALDEWRYTGDAYAFDDTPATCELCEQRHNRFLFGIANRHNGNALLIGPECIGKFRLGAGDLSAVNSSQTCVTRHTHALVTETNKRIQINTLVALAAADAAFDINSFLAPVFGRAAFTPNQLALLLWRLHETGIDHSACAFKLILRRDSEREQLRAMEHWKIKKLWPCLSARQRSWVQKHSGYRP